MPCRVLNTILMILLYNVYCSTDRSNSMEYSNVKSCFQLQTNMQCPMSSEQRISRRRAAGRWNDDVVTEYAIVFQCQEGPTPAHHAACHWLA